MTADTPSGLASAWARYVTNARKPGLALLLACTTAFMTVRFLWLVNQFAVDLLYWDGWDLWDGFFTDASAWSLWRFQWGPQRQGLAQWILAAIIWAFDWNARAEALGGAVIIVLAAGVGLLMVRSLRGRWSASDALIPIAMLTISLVAVATAAPNLAHGPLPLLLVMTCAYFAQVQRERVRVIGVAVTLALSIQTGFTWFMAIVVIPLQVVWLIEAVRAGRRTIEHVLGLALVVTSLALFFYGFRFEPAVGCFHFPDPQPWRYFVFIAVMVQRMTELPVRAVGLLGALSALGLVLWSGWTTVATAGRNRMAASILVLGAFPLIFAANTAVGRLCLGYEAATAGRYVAYTLPIAMAGYLFLALWPRWGRLRSVLIIAVLAMLAAKETVLAPGALTEARHFARIKLSFRECYFAEGNALACSAKWPIHPAPATAKVQEKLDYLRTHRLGLFRAGAK